MPLTTIKFNGKIDRRTPFNEGDFNNPILRENWLARDGKISKPRGNEAVITGLTSIPRWEGRYNSIAPGGSAPKSFVYTEDGKLHFIDSVAETYTTVKEVLNTNAYPRHTLIKVAGEIKMYFVDGVNLYSYDGNGDNLFSLVSVTDTSGNSVVPIDLIEHKDRLMLISETILYVSKNLDFEVFDDAIDSIAIIVGSGKGKNLAVRKIEDKLYIFNTEGIFVLDGDVISALASTFEVRLIDERKIVAGRTAVKVEKAIVFLADDYELWSWDGNSSRMLTYEFNLKQDVSTYQNKLERAVATYHDNYYKMSFVKKGDADNEAEIFWDAFEDKVDVVVGRNVSCYMKTDPTVETEYLEMGLTSANTIVRDDRGSDYNGSAIASRIRTRDVTPLKGYNVRFVGFYPEFMPTGIRDIVIRYLLDGRSSNPTGANATWDQRLRGETKTLGFIEIKNQSQTTDRVRPKIKYSRGESIGFEIIDETLGLKADLVSMGIEYVGKQLSKGRTIGA